MRSERISQFKVKNASIFNSTTGAREYFKGLFNQKVYKFP